MTIETTLIIITFIILVVTWFKFIDYLIKRDVARLEKLSNAKMEYVLAVEQWEDDMSEYNHTNVEDRTEEPPKRPTPPVISETDCL